AIDFAVLNAKAIIASKLTSTELLSPRDLRGIILAAAARYGALKIPSATENSWTLSSREIKHFPTKSLSHFKIIKKLSKIY
ncbi:Uncharacterized protein FKW44_006588, partial [Caligus rogercresseyi]